jgi:CheY-like chemotaxis protein
MFTVLIIDDNDDMRQALEEILRQNGYEICMPVGAPYAENAIKLLQTEKIDAVILDLNLGKDMMDGFDLARHMRDDPVWCKIPIILSSGMRSEEIMKKAHEYAFYGMRTINIGKPIDPKVLFMTLEGIKGQNG